jgi:hypothetical protein
MSRLLVGLLCILLLQGCAGWETDTAPGTGTQVITMYPGVWR